MDLLTALKATDSVRLVQPSTVADACARANLHPGSRQLYMERTTKAQVMNRKSSATKALNQPGIRHPIRIAIACSHHHLVWFCGLQKS